MHIVFLKLVSVHTLLTLEHIITKLGWKLRVKSTKLCGTAVVRQMCRLRKLSGWRAAGTCRGQSGLVELKNKLDFSWSRAVEQKIKVEPAWSSWWSSKKIILTFQVVEGTPPVRYLRYMYSIKAGAWFFVMKLERFVLFAIVN